MSPFQILIAAGILAFSLFLLILFVRRKIGFRRSMNMVFLRVLVPKKDSDQDEKRETVRDFKEQASLMEQLLASLKSISSDSLKSRIFGGDYISLEYIAYGQEIYFTLVVPKKIQNLVEKQVAGFYPDAIVEEIEEMNIFENKKVVVGARVNLKKPFWYPIKTYQKLESDSINPITSALGKLGEDGAAAIQILLRPIPDTWQEKVKKAEKKKGHGHFSWNPFVWIASGLRVIFSDPSEKSEHGKDEEPVDEEGTMKEKRKKT